MLHVFRETVGRYVAIAILALIGVTFVFWGVGNDIVNPQARYAAKVNGESIPIRLFEDEVLARQNQLQQQSRSELTDEVRLILRQQALDTLILREALLQKADAEGYRVSDQRVVDEIRRNPAFQVQGQFSNDVYKSRLSAEGYSVPVFEAQQREEATLRELEDAVMGSAFITPAEFRRSIELVYEKRQVAWAEFAAADFVDQVEISDEDIAAYHADNASQFMTEEAVDLEYIEVALADIAETIDISEDDMLAYYENETASYEGSEERHVRHIQIAIGDDPEAARAEADDVLARLEAGEDFATLAAEVSDDVGTAANGGDLGWMGRGVLPAPLDDTAFSMEIGALAGPVESAFGFHVLKLDNVRLSEQPPFASERERIRSALAEEQAYAAYDAAADELDDAAYNAIDDLAGVAEQLGLELQRIERFSRGNAGEHFVNGDIVAAVVFGDDAVLAGENSELIELAADVVGVVHVAAHHAPEPEPLEAVSDLIRELLTLDAAAELASAAAAEFSDALDPAAVVAETQDPAELAAMYGGSWHEPAWVQRTDVGDVPSAIRSRVLTEIRPTAGAVPKLSIPTGSYDEAVALLLAVEPGVPADIPTDEREQGQQELTSQMALAEFSAYASDTQQRAKVRVPDGVLDPDL